MLAIVWLSALLAAGFQQTVPSASAPAPEQSAVEKAQAAALANGSLQAPVLLSMVDPQFSERARKKKISGDILVSAIIDEQGIPQHVSVVRGIGYGLDEEAVKAVRQYRFTPATRDGAPVPFVMKISVNYQIF